MPELSSWLAYGLISLGMVLTPGPNMIYLISRSICQGRTAGLISLGGVALGFVVYMLCAALGITALVMAVRWAITYSPSTRTSLRPRQGRVPRFWISQVF